LTPQKQAEVLQIAFLNDAATTDSPKGQTIVGVWESIKGMKASQYKQNSQGFIDGLKDLCEPFSISTPSFCPEVDAPATNAPLDTDMVEELQEVLQEMTTNEVRAKIQQKMQSKTIRGEEHPQDKVSEGHLRCSEGSCFARLSKKQCAKDLFHCCEYQVCPIIVADDPELRKCIGCGALNSEFFCPFCDLRRSAWKEHGAKAPSELKDFNKLVEWGEKNAKLSALVDKKKQLKRKRAKVKKQKENTPEWRKRVERLEAKVAQATKETYEHFQELTNFTDKVTLKVIAEYYEGCLGQRYPPIIEGVTLFNYAACALHAYLNITAATFRFTSALLQGHSNLWLHFKREMVKLQLHNIVAFVQKKKNDGEENERSVKKQQKKMQRLQLIGRDCRKLERNMVTVLDGMVKKFDGDKRVQEMLSHMQEVWKCWGMVAPYLRMKRIENEETIYEGQRLARKFIDTFALHTSDDELTYYMHLLDSHVWQWSLAYYKEFGCGYGILTTQAVEHRLKVFKRELRNTMKNRRMYRLALNHQSQRINGRLRIRKPTSRLFKCSACGQQGHQKNNKRCPRNHD
jgi:hypothetical protein